MATKDKTPGRYVANRAELGIEYRIGNDYNAVEHFNAKVLPFLKALDAFTKRDIEYYYRLDRKRIYAMFLAQQLKPVKDEIERIEIAQSVRSQFEEWETRYFEEHGGYPDVLTVSDEGLKYVAFDEKKGLFTFDVNAYRADALSIYARTDKELEVLEKIEAVAKAVNALGVDYLRGSASLGQLSLIDFIDVIDGVAVVKPRIYTAAWELLIERNNK